MNDKVYAVVKWIAVIVLPAVATLYGTLAMIWGLPYGEEIVNTIIAVDTFLGAVMMISTAQYNKKVVQHEDTTKK